MNPSTMRFTTGKNQNSNDGVDAGSVFGGVRRLCYWVGFYLNGCVLNINAHDLASMRYF